MDKDTHRRIQATVNCLICSKPINLMFPHSANCTGCGCVYTDVEPAKIIQDKHGDILVLQQTLISGKGDGGPINIEQKIQWRL